MVLPSLSNLRVLKRPFNHGAQHFFPTYMFQFRLKTHFRGLLKNRRKAPTCLRLQILSRTTPPPVEYEPYSGAAAPKIRATNQKMAHVFQEYIRFYTQLEIDIARPVTHITRHFSKLDSSRPSDACPQTRAESLDRNTEREKNAARQRNRGA